jgi:hypothetical protein
LLIILSCIQIFQFIKDSGAIGVLFLAIVARQVWYKVDENTVNKIRTLDNMMQGYKVKNQLKIIKIIII